MVITVPVKGYFEENSFFYIDEATGHGFAVDPGAEGDRLVEYARSRGWIIEKILLTHGHFDHTGGVAAMREAYGCPVLAHENARDYAQNPKWNLSVFCGTPILLDDLTLVRDGDEIALDADPEVRFRVLFTPGHTTDSVIYYNEREGFAFTGDTIFKGSIGNDRFPGGSLETMLDSIRRRVFTLPPETVLFSGHTKETTVGDEMRGWMWGNTQGSTRLL